MKSFARVTKLTNIGGRSGYIGNPERQKAADAFPPSADVPDAGGRADYISNPKRQENIVAASPPIDWKPYQEYERANQKTATKNNEGREVIIALPNDWDGLPHGELTVRAQALAVAAAGKETDIEWAVHWNKSHTNLHMHVIFSERKKIKDAEKYDRDIYLTADGKVARRKSDRAKGADGKDMPPAHRKGEEKGGFTAKDARYKEKSWVYEMKAAVKQEMGRFGVDIEPPELLSQHHEGKGKESLAIHEKNELIKITNALLKAAQLKYGISHETMKIIARDAIKILRQNLIPVVHMEESRLSLRWITLEQFMERLKARSQEVANSQLDEIKQLDTLPAHIRQQPEAQPPKPDFSFAALIGAQHEYFRQIYALNLPPPRPSAIAAAPGEVRNALAAFEAANKAVKSAAYERSKIGFFTKGKKKKRAAIDEKTYTAHREKEAAASILKKHGVTMYRDGVDMSELSFDDRAAAIIRQNAEKKIYELQREADFEARFEDPDNTLKPLPEAAKIAQERFTALLREIPLENRNDALKSLVGAHSGITEGYKSVIASMKAIDAVQNAIKQEMPLPPPTSAKTRRKERSREMER